MNQNCEKVGYSDRHKANVALRLIARKGKMMRVYSCPRCHKWHLTSDLKKYDNGR